MGVLPPSPFPRLPHLLPMQLNSREGGLLAGRVDRAGCAAFPRLPHPLPMQLNSRDGGLPEVRLGVLPSLDCLISSPCSLTPGGVGWEGG